MKVKNYLLMMMTSLFIAASALFVSCSEEEIEPYVSHRMYYVSEVKGYTGLNMPLGYEPVDKRIYLDFDGINYTFCEYSIEIRKGSASGKVVKSFTVRGEDIKQNDKTSDRVEGKIPETWEGVSGYSEFDAYIVLTAVKMPDVTVEFNTAGSDFTETHNFYFVSAYEEDVPSLFYSTLSKVHDFFTVHVIDKKAGDLNGAELSAIDSSAMKTNFTLDITVDGVPASDVFAEYVDGVIDYMVQWQKFTYAQLDPSKPHSIKVTVKQKPEA